MGLIKAAIGAVGGTLADQWKEFIVIHSLQIHYWFEDKNVLENVLQTQREMTISSHRAARSQ